VLRRAVGIVVVIVGCAGVAPSSAAAIDPLVPGSHDVRTIEYSAGALRLDLPGTSSLGPITVQQPLEGSNLDARNPMPIANRARPATQRLDVVLRDRGGRRAGVAAERFSSALDPPVGTGLRQLLLNDVRIPLTRFRGVDLRRLAAIELRFGVRGRRSGAIQLADMAFQ
jgi:hypothetical protein